MSWYDLWMSLYFLEDEERKSLIDFLLKTARGEFFQMFLVADDLEGVGRRYDAEYLLVKVVSMKVDPNSAIIHFELEVNETLHPCGIKPGCYKFVFDDGTGCHNLPEEMFEEGTVPQNFLEDMKNWRTE